MKIAIRHRHVVFEPHERELVERRVRFAMGRFSSVIPAVTVTLLDDNGPRGGLDKLCRVALSDGQSGPLVAEARDQELMAAVSTAVDRAARTLARRRERSRAGRRH